MIYAVIDKKKLILIMAVIISSLVFSIGIYSVKVSENAGSLDENDAPVEGYADAQIDPERGVVICRSADPSVYAIQGDGTALFGPESYHSRDYSFYYENIKQNAADRIAAFFK